MPRSEIIHLDPDAHCPDRRKIGGNGRVMVFQEIGLKQFKAEPGMIDIQRLKVRDQRCLGHRALEMLIDRRGTS